MLPVSNVFIYILNYIIVPILVIMIYFKVKVLEEQVIKNNEQIKQTRKRLNQLIDYIKVKDNEKNFNS